MKRSMLVVLAALALLGGCKDPAKPAQDASIPPKWKGLPYRLSLDSQPPKPGTPAPLIPKIHFTANPDALETRAVLVVRYDASALKLDTAVMDQFIMPPVDIHGAEGALPDDYMASANKSLLHLFDAYKIKGKLPVKMALARSSLSNQSGDGEIQAKRLSDWITTVVEYKGGKK